MSASGRLLGLIAVLATGCIASVILDAAGIRINLSPSAPLGVFVASQVPADSASHLERGMLVAVCLPPSVARWGRARAYLMRGSCADGTAPVGKTILAVAGDTVRVSSGGLALGSRVICGTSPLARDGQGRAMPRIGDGAYAVSVGEIWLISNYTARSWDSRYFGPVPTTGVVATLRPVWTIRREEPDTGRDRSSATNCSDRIR
jgi:conjugative transfer signal peptidase TraF